jgi:hypothetical protein
MNSLYTFLADTRLEGWLQMATKHSSSGIKGVVKALRKGKSRGGRGEEEQ